MTLKRSGTDHFRRILTLSSFLSKIAKSKTIGIMEKNAFLFRSADSTLVCSFYIKDSNHSFRDLNDYAKFHFFTAEKTF